MPASKHPLLLRYGPWAVVAGASEGIGQAFAEELATAGVGLVLVARRPAPLAQTAAHLRESHQVETLEVVADLAASDGAAQVLAALGAREVGLLVYNAALSVSGSFVDVPLATHQQALQVNCLTPLALVHTLAGAMRARGRGGVIWMSSLSGTVGTACLATYSGTKAFANIFGEALWDELRAEGVDVLVSCAGATLTPGYEQRKPRSLPVLAPRPMSAATVARDALAKLGRGPRTIPGRGNRLAAFAMRHLMTRRRAVRTMGRAGREVHAATTARWSESEE